MSNGKMIKKENNVVFFPGIEKRLLEDGLNHLNRKNYREAISLLEDVIQIDSKNSDAYIGLLLAYFDAGIVEKAMVLVKKMFHEGIGNEIDTINIYIMLLIQGHEYEEVVTVIKKVLEDQSLSKDRFDHFKRLLRFCERMLDNQIEVKKLGEDDVITEELNFFQYSDPHEQILVAEELNKRNIYPYIKEIKSYLQLDDGDPFFKSLLINVLREHHYDKPVDIIKFGRHKTIFPETLQQLDDNMERNSLIDLISQNLENEDPTLFANVKSIVERQFFLLYPFELEFQNIPAWAAAFHLLGNEYYGNEHTEKELMEEYGVLQEDLDRANTFIRMIEEISYRNV